MDARIQGGDPNVRPILFAAHKEIKGSMPGAKEGAANNPWIQHIKRSVYTSPHPRLQVNMESECSDSSLLGSGTSSGRGGCASDAGIVKS